MGKTVGDVQLAMLHVVESDGLPGPELRRSGADVDDDVHDRSGRAAQELGLPGLVVHAARDPFAGTRVVVLDEVGGDAELRQRIAPEGLDKEAALVAVNGGRQEHRA